MLHDNPEYVAPVAIDAEALIMRTGAGLANALLDVREPGEAERGHIFGATNLPRRLLEFRIAELVRDRQTVITVYDDETGRAQRAATTLAGLGYQNVAWLDGGIAAWQRAGHRLATGTNVPSKQFGESIQAGCSVPGVTPSELSAWQQAGRRIVICDVRTPEEYAEACIPGGVSAPGFDYALHARDLDRAYEVLVVNCAGRTRSIIAAQTLIELGLRNVVALENGTIGWRLAGLKVETGADRRLPVPSTTGFDGMAGASRALADQAGIARYDSAELRRLQDAPFGNLYVFDVRRVADYATGHIAGSIALPGGQAVQRADDFIAVREATVVLVDEHEVQANLTAVWLHRMGYRNVAVLIGGIPGWLAGGGALVSGRTRRTPLGWELAKSSAVLESADVCAMAIDQRPDMLLIDVGTSRKFRRGHLPGAKWLPRGWLEMRIAALTESPARPILVSCEDGTQSTYAAAALRDAGYTDVRVLSGGLRAWKATGRPLEATSLPPQDDVLIPPYDRGEQGMREYIAWETHLIAPHAITPNVNA